MRRAVIAVAAQHPDVFIRLFGTDLFQSYI